MNASNSEPHRSAGDLLPQQLLNMERDRRFRFLRLPCYASKPMLRLMTMQILPTISDSYHGFLLCMNVELPVVYSATHSAGLPLVPSPGSYDTLSQRRRCTHRGRAANLHSTPPYIAISILTLVVFSLMIIRYFCQNYMPCVFFTVMQFGNSKTSDQFIARNSAKLTITSD